MSTELAWAAGFFDGEGCTYSGRSKHMFFPKIEICQVHPEVLERFVAAVERGRVKGPYRSGYGKQTNAKPRYKVTYSRHVACEVIDLLWPYLGSVKRKQASFHINRWGDPIE